MQEIKKIGCRDVCRSGMPEEPKISKGRNVIYHSAFCFVLFNGLVIPILLFAQLA